MTPFETLSEREIEMAQDYITTYASEQNLVPKDMEIVFANWDENKSKYLFKMFGEQLILSRAIEFSKSYDELEKDINRQMHRWMMMGHTPMSLFEGAFCAAVEKFIRLAYPNDWRMDLLINTLISSSCLARNAYDGDDFTIEINGKSIRVNNGCKPLKVIKKIADELGIEGFEEFRIAHSQILNQKQLKGNLVISIHPLDYMTMSDNQCGWSSCMSWYEHGGYRQGTVEMMNSPMVVVAYLTSEKEWCPFGDGDPWSNKKWRELFIVKEDLIMEVKSYPYHNYELSGIVMDWLRQLAKDNLNWEYLPTTHYFKHDIIKDDLGRNWSLNPQTWGMMYNDFGSMPQGHQTIFTSNPEVDPENIGWRNQYEFNYCGPSQCMICGGDMDDGRNDDDESGFLTCNECEPSTYCSCCGCRIVGDDVSWVGDNPVCCYCYDEKCSQDDITGEAYYIEDLNRLYLAEKKDKVNECEDLYLYTCLCDIPQYDWDRLFTISQDEIRTAQIDRWTSVQYVNKDDLTEEGFEFFNRYGN